MAQIDVQDLIDEIDDEDEGNAGGNGGGNGGGKQAITKSMTGQDKVQQVMSVANQHHVDELRVYLTEIKVLKPRGIPR